MTFASRNLAIAQLMLNLFPGRTDRILVDNDGNVVSKEPDIPLTAEILAEEHLTHSTGYGVYPLHDDGCVHFAAIDFDDKGGKQQNLLREKVGRVCNSLQQAGLGHLVEISQSGNGFHVWLFFERPIKAVLVRRLIRGLLGQLDLIDLEVFPKQDTVSPNAKYGNAIRLPLYNHSHFVDIDADWTKIPPLKALRGVIKLTKQQLIDAAKKLGIDLDPPKAQRHGTSATSATVGLPNYVQELLNDENSTLARRWRGDTAGLKDGSNSGVAMSIAVCLVRAYVPTADVEATLRHWCVAHCRKKGERDDWIDRTIESAYEFAQRGRLSRQESNTDCGLSPAMAREVRRALKRKR